jgi:hypothetical protein
MLQLRSPFSVETFIKMYQLHGAEPFLRSRKLRSCLRTSQHLMESVAKLPCLQEPFTGPYPDQSSPYHPHIISPRSILILSIYLLLGLRSGPFPSGFPTNILYALLFTPFVCPTCPAHFILLDFIILIILCEDYKL